MALAGCLMLPLGSRAATGGYVKPPEQFAPRQSFVNISLSQLSGEFLFNLTVTL
jgi:hypothetical protein